MQTATEFPTPPAEPVAAPRRARGRLVFRLLTSAAWALALVLCAEVLCWAVWVLAQVLFSNTPAAVRGTMAGDDKAYGEWVARAEGPPFEPREGPGLSVSPWLTDGTLDPLRAEASHAVLFEMDGSGRMSALTYAAEPPEILKAGEALAASGRPDALFSPEQLGDLLLTLDIPFSGPAEYMLAPGGFPPQCYEAAHYPHPRERGRRAVLVRQSRYLECMRSYRPRAYRRDFYGNDFLRSEFWTNSLGWRDREIALPKPAGLYRIVLIGGSTAMEGPHNDLTCAKYLERLFAAEFGPGHVEVVNAGVDALTTYASLERMDDYLALQPDMIVHYNFVNDAESVIAAAAKEDFPENSAAARALRILAFSALARLAAPDLFYPGETALAGQVDRLVLGNLRAIADRCEWAGVRLVVATFARPDPDRLFLSRRLWLNGQFFFYGLTRVSYRQYAALTDIHNRLLHAWAGARGIACVPVAEETGGAPALFTDICHMHLGGIERKAEILFRHLRDKVPGLDSGGAS